jgi:hypothetical protein
MAFKEAVVTESEYRAAVYRQLKEHGVCIGCRRADAIKGMVYCPECRAKMLAYQAERRNRLKREGICLTCQSEPAVPGTTKCAACRDWNTQYNRIRRERLTAAGLCTRCRRKLPPDYEYKVCPECREKARQYRQRYKVMRGAKPDAEQ